MIRTEDIPDDLRGDVLRSMRSGGDSLFYTLPHLTSAVLTTGSSALLVVEGDIVVFFNTRKTALPGDAGQI